MNKALVILLCLATPALAAPKKKKKAPTPKTPVEEPVATGQAPGKHAEFPIPAKPTSRNANYQA